MSETIIANESVIRLVCFLGVFTTVAMAEVLVPQRDLTISRWIRWANNLTIVALNSVLLRLLVPTAALALAVIAEQHNWGLLNNFSMPLWAATVLAMLVLDLSVYFQHVLFHAVPVLWRLHRMHHADVDFDVTTGARFHPIEILLSMGVKLVVVATLGPPPVAVLLFEVVLNATAMFNHGNLRIPSKIDRVLRWIVVTPDMHRVHHSILPQEANSNFGFNMPWWDRLLGTYRDQPAAGHRGMTIGIEDFRDSREHWIDRLLVQPFRGETGIYPINRDVSPS